MIQNLDIDMVGFREAVHIAGELDVLAVLDNCGVRCSGDDAVHICGKAQPLIVKCNISVGVEFDSMAEPCLLKSALCMRF